MLDFYSMKQLIGFNHKNQWHFMKTEHKFAFAFTDLSFDKHGFPTNGGNQLSAVGDQSSRK